MLPTIWQRFTKYPLLLEKLYKSTVKVSPDNLTEIEAIQEVLQATKDILNHVNQSFIIAEDDEKYDTRFWSYLWTKFIKLLC